MEFLTLTRDASVATLTLVEPRRRNPISLPMREELLAALDGLRDDPELRVLVLTGAGGFFSSGGDISSMTDDPAAGVYRLHLLNRVVAALVELPVPVVAAVEGGAYGAGLSLVAACDHVVVAADARLCASFGAIGLGSDGGLSATLARRAGHGRATELLMFGEVVDADRAERIGLADRVVEPGTALAAAHTRAGLLAARSRPALAAVKATLAGRHPDVRAVLADEAERQLGLLAGTDFAEGRAAFAERRAPRFRA